MAAEEAKELELPEAGYGACEHTNEGIRISYQIVATPESEIRKNNRLALLVDIHSRRRDKQQETEREMAVKKEAKCESCGKGKLNLSSCSGDVICSSCAAMYGAINNRMPGLAPAVARLGKADSLVGYLTDKLGKEWLIAAVQAHLPEQVSVTIENETLDEVARLIGYTGESSEGLLAHIAELATVETERAHYQTLADGRLALMDKIAAIVGVSPGIALIPKDIEDYAQRVCQAGEERVNELEQLLADSQVESLVQAVETTEPVAEEDWLLRLRDLLGMPVSHPGELVDAVALQLESADVASTELAAIRQTLAVTDPRYSIISAIAELTCTLDHLKTQSARYATERDLLADQLSEMEWIAPVTEQTVTAGASPLDSHLLDLLIEYPSIGVERIAVLREAA